MLGIGALRRLSLEGRGAHLPCAGWELMLNALMASACRASLGGTGARITERLAGCGPAGGQKEQRGVLG